MICSDENRGRTARLVSCCVILTSLGLSSPLGADDGIPSCPEFLRAPKQVPCLSSDATNTPACYLTRSPEVLQVLLRGTANQIPPPQVCGEVVDSVPAAKHILEGHGTLGVACRELQREALAAIFNIRVSILAGDGQLGEDSVECFLDAPTFQIPLACGNIFVPDPNQPAEPLVVTEQTPLSEFVALAGQLCELASCPTSPQKDPCFSPVFQLALILKDINGSLAHNGLCAQCAGNTTPPVLNCPFGVLTFECDGPKGSTIDYTVTAVDDCDPNPHVTCFPPPGTRLGLDTVRTVDCAAQDSHGNRTCCSFQVEVRDTTPPQMFCPTAPLVATCDIAGQGGAVVQFPDPGTADICDPNVTVICVPPSGSFFPLGSTTVVCTASDASQNTSVCTFEVEVVDLAEPVLNVPADMTVECTGPGGAVVD